MKHLLLILTTAAIALLIATVISQAIILKTVLVVGIIFIIGFTVIWAITYKEYKKSY